MKPQIVIIHGGMCFDTYEEYITYLRSAEFDVERATRKEWKGSLAALFPDHQVIFPSMPNSKNARYLEWKIWFEKVLPFLHDNVILIGHSLGGIFLAKYLSENEFPCHVQALHLVAAPYDTEIIKDSLVDFALSGPVNALSERAEKIYIYQSKDDDQVAFKDAEKYHRDIPNAKFITFTDRGHFLQETFPELVENIRAGS